MATLSHNTATKGGQRPPVALFFATTVVIFFSTLSAADSIGFVPYYIDGTDPAPLTNQSPSQSIGLGSLPQLGTVGIQPTHLSIPAINLDLPVQNPATRDVDVLDDLLRHGPARYVDSAQLNEDGNVLIFAHSSHLLVVHNQMFRAFNHIPDLQAGDEVDLTGADGKTYVYRVTAPAERADVSDATATINLSHAQGKKLTLITCDTLTGKSARFVLTADFVRAQ